MVLVRRAIVGLLIVGVSCRRVPRDPTHERAPQPVVVDAGMSLATHSMEGPVVDDEAVIRRLEPDATPAEVADWMTQTRGAYLETRAGQEEHPPVYCLVLNSDECPGDPPANVCDLAAIVFPTQKGIYYSAVRTLRGMDVGWTEHDLRMGAAMVPRASGMLLLGMFGEHTFVPCADPAGSPDQMACDERTGYDVVCGVGPSGIPSCTDPQKVSVTQIVEAIGPGGPGEAQSIADVRLYDTITADGRLSLGPLSGSLVHDKGLDLSSEVGTYSLRFQ
jgi:hypothetical protein